MPPHKTDWLKAGMRCCFLGYRCLVLDLEGGGGGGRAPGGGRLPVPSSSDEELEIGGRAIRLFFWVIGSEV